MIIIILRKSNKPDYIKSNAYRSITLECTIDKTLKSIATELLNYLIETYDLLPANHFEAHPQCIIKDTIMILSENIYKTWKHEEIFMIVFMNIAETFNNVHHNKLIHNMKQRYISLQIIKLIQSFLTKWTTQLCFNETISIDINIEARIPQESSLSPILFMLYNTEFLEIIEISDLTLGFIDDIVYDISELTIQRNIKRLQKILSKSEKWKEKHDTQFKLSKYILIHFICNIRLDITIDIQLNNTTISSSKEAHYLDMIFDQKLKFHSHLKYIIKKDIRFVLALSNITRITWDISFKYIKRLYTQ